MQLVTEQALSLYSKKDALMHWLDHYSEENDERLTCQRWLRESLAKRFIYQQLYGDLLSEGRPMRVLDIGGGLTCMTRVFAEHHDYILVDLSAHDDPTLATQLNEQVGREVIISRDWHDCNLEKFDLVIANDLFPNVDQRLDLFLNKFIPSSSAIRMSLTWYNEPRFYLTRRIDGDEILAMLSWNGAQVKQCLIHRQQYMEHPDLNIFDTQETSVYPNDRHVCVVKFTMQIGIK